MCPSHQELELFHDGELSAARTRWVKEHVEGCGDCSAVLEELRSMSSLLSSAVAPEMSRMGVARLDRRVADLPAVRLRRTAAVLSGVAAGILLFALPRAMRVLNPPAAPPANARSTAVLPAWQTIALSPSDGGGGGSVAVDASGNEQLADWMTAQLAPRGGGRND